MSNQYSTSPPPGPANRPPASSMIERLPRGLSTRANLLAFAVAAVFSIIAYGFTSIGRYVHVGYWRLVWVAAYCVIGLIAAIACAILVTYLRRRGRRAQAKGKASSSKLYAVIYETCKARSGATSLTVDVYRHSWIIVDARVE